MSTARDIYGLQGARSAVAPARQEINSYHVGFARDQRRLGRGWQTIANMLQVNAETLRGAVEGASPTAARKTVEPLREVAARFGAGEFGLKVLMAIEAGVAGLPAPLAHELGCCEQATSEALGRLRRAGLVEKPALRAPSVLTGRGLEAAVAGRRRG